MVYSTFMKWCESKNFRSYSENCLLAYFQSISSKSKKSLWSVYSMLKACVIIHNNIDISRFTKLIAFIKRETENQEPKKSRVFDNDQITKFINEAPDSSFLLMKVYSIYYISINLYFITL